MQEALRWFVRSFGPYVVGVVVGVFFAYLLTLFVSGTKVPTSYEQWLAIVDEASHAVHATQAVTTPATAPEKIITPTPAVVAPEVKHAPKPPSSTPVVAIASVVTPTATAATLQPAATPAAAPAATPVVDKKEENRSKTPPPATPPIPKTGETLASKTTVPAKDKEDVAAKENPSPDNVLSCGAPPRQPSAEMNRYLACRWKENCLNRLAQARYMIEQGKLRCPTSGYNAQACQTYYQSLEERYQPSMCEH